MQARSRALGPLSPSFELVKNLRLAFTKFLPENAYKIATGRLHISLTRVSDRKNILVSEFSDNNDLIDVRRLVSCVIFLAIIHYLVCIVLRGHLLLKGLFVLHQF